jgi:hypothetical protein
MNAQDASVELQWLADGLKTPGILMTEKEIQVLVATCAHIARRLYVVQAALGIQDTEWPS